MNLPIVQENVWYEKGLPFKCTGCGKCCSGAPGYVWVTEDEIQEMAASLGIAPDLFKRKYTRLVGNRYSLTELKKDGYSCVFLQDNKCKVYSCRPRQCRTFPFWPQNLNSKESWERVALECEGINDEAPLIPLDQIQQNLQNC